MQSSTKQNMLFNFRLTLKNDYFQFDVIILALCFDASDNRLSFMRCSHALTWCMSMWRACSPMSCCWRKWRSALSWKPWYWSAISLKTITSRKPSWRNSWHLLLRSGCQRRWGGMNAFIKCDVEIINEWCVILLLCLCCVACYGIPLPSWHMLVLIRWSVTQTQRTRWVSTGHG